MLINFTRQSKVGLLDLFTLSSSFPVGGNASVGTGPAAAAPSTTSAVVAHYGYSSVLLGRSPPEGPPLAPVMQSMLEIWIGSLGRTGIWPPGTVTTVAVLLLTGTYLAYRWALAASAKPKDGAASTGLAPLGAPLAGLLVLVLACMLCRFYELFASFKPRIYDQACISRALFLPPGMLRWWRSSKPAPGVAFDRTSTSLFAWWPWLPVLSPTRSRRATGSSAGTNQVGRIFPPVHAFFSDPFRALCSMQMSGRDGCSWSSSCTTM